MANYQYSYNDNSPQQGGNPNDRNFWLVAVILFFIFPPASILMIVLKLVGGTPRRATSSRTYQFSPNSRPMGARTTSGTAFSDPNTASPSSQQTLLSSMANQGRRLTIVGGIISAVFGFVVLTALPEALYWLLDGEFAWFVRELASMLPLLCFLFGGLGCLWAGLRKQKRARNFRKYMAMFGTRSAVSISSLASTLGVSPTKIRAELEEMLDVGLLPTAYLDYGRDQLVLSGDGIADAPEEPEVKKDSDTQNPQDAVLQEIYAINRDIDNPKLSQQIDRIGIITAKVFEYQRSHPEKSPQLHSFLSYYLPTTLKILRAYAQLEDQEVTGENISTAMVRIENMMDKVVEGFEKQLDQLFQGDALDITADVEVLERMLAKDGLSSNGQMHFG